jgi:hypothetical protein
MFFPRQIAVFFHGFEQETTDWIDGYVEHIRINKPIMRDEYRHLDQREALKVENEVIKMKLMLEHGAEFSGNESAPPLSPETEHQFLQYILEVERKESMAREVTVFEIIGSPSEFPSSGLVKEDGIKDLLQRLLQRMKQHGIELTVFSPNVTPRDIYAFVTTELFAHRMLHIQMPGMVTCFIYDEFHPDYPYENSRTAVNECLKEIFCSRDLQWVFQYEQILQLNAYENLSIDQFRRTVNAFKKRYRNIEPLVLDVTDCKLSDEHCEVTGRFEVCFSTADEHLLKTGTWKVAYHYWKEMDIWMIYEVYLEGIEF